MKVKCKTFTGIVAGALVLALASCSATNPKGNGPSTTAQGPQSDMNTDQQTLMSAGRKAEEERKYDVAANAYGRLFERRTDDPVVLAAFIRTMRYSDRSREIANYVESKTQHLINDPGVKFEFAKALLAAGRKSEALIQLREVVLVQPDNWQVLSAMGITFDAMGAFPQAIESYSKALQMSPNNVVVLNNLAMSQAMAGQIKTAIATLENAANINRSNSQIRQNLALLYAVSGDLKKAHALAAMDLAAGDLETNLSFYRRFEGAAHE
jgi:Flp pilus assembly protein TadD